MRSARADHRSATAVEAPEPVVAPAEPDGVVAFRPVPAAGLVGGPDGDALRRRAGEPHDPLGGSHVGPEIGGALARLRGGGRPLPDSIARPMGQAMGADLGGVRIHTGPEPARLARSVQATAFTLGRDIFFGAGSYAPHTSSGQRLLAHELAHTVTPESGGAPAGGPIIGRAADPAEAHADRVADDTLRAIRRHATAPAEPVGWAAAPAGSLSVLRSRSAGADLDLGGAVDRTPLVKRLVDLGC
jgi:hypothetical protein